MTRRADLTWRGLHLCKVGSTKPLISIEPDSVYPGMWRVRIPDGSLSDMVNKTRARDAAALIIDASLRVGESAVEAPPRRSNRSPKAIPPPNENAAPVR